MRKYKLSEKSKEELKPVVDGFVPNVHINNDDNIKKLHELIRNNPDGSLEITELRRRIREKNKTILQTNIIEVKPKMEEGKKDFKVLAKQNEKAINDYYYKQFRVEEKELEVKLKELKAKKKLIIETRNKLNALRKLETISSDDELFIESSTNILDKNEQAE